MKWLVYRGEYLAGHFFCDDKDRGFRNWCWVKKITHPDNYTVVPAPKRGEEWGPSAPTSLSK